MNILKVKGRSDLFLKLEIIKKILIVVVIAISIRYGIMGLIWGQLFTSIVALAINTHYSGKFIKYNALEQFLDMIPIILLAFLVGASIWMADNFLNINQLDDFYRLVILGISGTALYLLFAYMFKMDSLTSIKKIILKQ